MGQVFKAYHVSMDRVVALKIIPRGRVSDPVAVARFYREVRAVAQLSHSNIVTAFEVNQVGETHFLAMEYVDGIDLARLVQQSGPLPVPNACEYIRQAAVGLQHAHERGLVHRDVKPGNLMVARPSPDEPPVVKILDFGLARFESESTQAGRLTQFGKIVGTADYIAPEQAANARTADIRADIYSLGCSLYYLLTAQPPFPGDEAVEKVRARMTGDAPSVRKVRPEVSPALEQILAQMMARNPADRFQTPGEVAKALGAHTAKRRQGPDNAAPAPDSPIDLKPRSRPAKEPTSQVTGLSSPEALSQERLFRPVPSEGVPAGGERQPDRKKHLYLAFTLGGLFVVAGAGCVGALVIGLILWAVRSSPSASSPQAPQPVLASNQPNSKPRGEQHPPTKPAGSEKPPGPWPEQSPGKPGGSQQRDDANGITGPEKYIITDVGPPQADDYNSSAMAINSAGQVVVYCFGEDRQGPVYTTVVYDGIRLTDVGNLTRALTVGQGINDSGHVVGYIDHKGKDGSRAFVYDGKKVRFLEEIERGSTRAYAINKHGRIVGWSNAKGYIRAFLYDGAAMKDLGTLGGLSSEAHAINDAGLVVGKSTVPDGEEHAFLYDGTGMKSLSPLTDAWAIGSSGQVVGCGSVRAGGEYAALYQNGMTRDLSLPTWRRSIARGINSAGQIVGEATTRSGYSFAFLVEGGKHFNLNDLIEPKSGWVLISAWGINDRGQIVGSGRCQNQSRAFLLTPKKARLPGAEE
jgi:serine/threonine-protein kinase